MNPIRLHRFTGIQLEQQSPHNLKVNCELNILAVLVVQLRSLGRPQLIISVEDRGKEGIKHLCLVYVLGCEATTPIL